MVVVVVCTSDPDDDMFKNSGIPSYTAGLRGSGCVGGLSSVWHLFSFSLSLML